MSEFVICGDTSAGGMEFKGSLICLGGATRSGAERYLAEMIAEQDERLEGYTNLCVEEVKAADCWWRDPGLAN